MGELICNDCGYTFYEEDIAVWYEDRGEYWGAPCKEKMTGCPRCFSADITEYKEDEDDDDDEC